MKLFNKLVELEKSLQNPSIRRSRKQLEGLIADDFMEIGASGVVYNRAQIIKNLLNEMPAEISSTGFEYRKLSNELSQLIYRSNSTRRAIRSSIWQLQDGEWRIVFHQGTVADAGE